MDITTAANELFALLHDRLKAGDYVPASETEAAQYMQEVPEISSLCYATTNADTIAAPTAIEIYAHRVTSPIAVTYWISPAIIEAQHSGFDDNHDPYPLNARHPINPEELVDLHGKFFPGAVADDQNAG
jgi:hypothetical protein